MYGKKSFGIVRSSFLINEKGFIVEAWYKISPKDPVTKAIETLSPWRGPASGDDGTGYKVLRRFGMTITG